MARYELTDAQWDRIAYFFPHSTHWAGAGHPWHPHRPLVNGILWHLHTGAPWRDVAAQYGPWQTVYDRFNGWRRTVLGPESLPPCSTSWMMRGGSAENCGASMLRSFEPVVRLRGPENSPSNRVHWAATRRRNSKSQKTMRWDVRGEALAPRCT